MNTILEIFNNFIIYIEGLGPWGIALLSAAVIIFAVQMWYYTARYGRIMKYAGRMDSATKPPLSVITVIAEADYGYMEETLPLILAQDYGDFEVVLVDLSGDADFSEALSVKAKADGRISITRLSVNPQFPISNKMALNMGIKAARNEHLIFTTPDSYPCSSAWLPLMAAAFDEADIVLGYCGMEVGRTTCNRIIRASITACAARWISAALRGKPYRGAIRNMAFTKGVYFDNNGFNHLNLNIGEDDLFIQQIVSENRTAVVLEPDSFVRRKQWGGRKWWWRERLLTSNAFRFYTADVRRYISAELWFRTLFFACIVIMAILMPFEIKVFAATLLCIRFGTILAQTVRISRRLCEPALWIVLPIYDLCSPLYEAILAVTRRMRRTPGLWR